MDEFLGEDLRYAKCFLRTKNNPAWHAETTLKAGDLESRPIGEICDSERQSSKLRRRAPINCLLFQESRRA